MQEILYFKSRSGRFFVATSLAVCMCISGLQANIAIADKDYVYDSTTSNYTETGGGGSRP
ncbi:hypothetical protein [Campylobacter iguaniorum]|uniref:hypothetical protein n=1 Tax=Campylobacter iguaniorum TaxID=1244531 RepID=UPI00073A3199|nr:hypothetical protein [Campylobacter iguaniorum]